MRTRRIRSTFVMLVLLTLALTPAVPAMSAPADTATQRIPGAEYTSDEPLDILLTNDDGYQNPALNALRQALAGAGHNVTVVAPCEEQSGTGTAQSTNYVRGEPTQDNTITAREVEPDVWAVCGFPGDAVLFGVQHAFDSGRPDLVVSGVNPGHNSGAVTNHSGTVGATVMASELAIPAIATSVEIDPTTRPPSVGSISEASAYTARLIERLQATSDDGALLPEHVTLNVNYPAADEPQGTRVTRTGRTAFVRPRFEATDLCADCYLVLPHLNTDRDPVRRSDNNALADDYISVTPLDGDWTASDRDRYRLRLRLARLE
ncbi:5'/3'-nucleotidase SurE [Haloechinothrix sp. YIM 98757]|uniref:5'-nucleotidase SurE n=1 Tax=Haloechinothrix aidingensis TaxID=2752311 RepID=A0A838AE43_9PSEU|nr:5'/3'-nucleotidase SurE [Haloechinothrix aidingensis]MBA0127481.1 5'/3'-nucleotidase SurE [Haloechinothrix aidingensis]